MTRPTIHQTAPHNSYTFNSVDNGQHTFIVTLTSSVAQTISFVDVANALLNASATLTVGAAAGGRGGTGGGGAGGGGGTGGGHKP